jgi:hypothetical protein
MVSEYPSDDMAGNFCHSMFALEGGTTHDEKTWISPSGSVCIHQSIRYLTCTLSTELQQEIRELIGFRTRSLPTAWIPKDFVAGNLLQKSLEIKCTRWELYSYGREIVSTDKLVRCTLHPHNRRFSVLFPMRVVDIDEKRNFMYQMVEQHYSIKNCPSYWLYPLSKLLEACDDSELVFYGQALRERSDHIQTPFYCTTTFPTIDETSLQVSNSENVAFRPSYGTLAILRWEKSDIVYETIPTTEGVEIECVYPDGSLFRTSDDFRFISYFSPDSPMENLYHIASDLETISNHERNTVYPLREIIADCLMLYQKFHSSRSSNRQTKKQQVIHPKVVKQIHVPGIVDIGCYSNGDCKARFEDGTRIEMPTRVDEYSIASIVDKEDDHFQVRVFYPLGFEK